jgi:hypothetical protein
MSEIVQFPGSADAETRLRQAEDRKREREERVRTEAARLEERRMLLERARRTREERKKITALTERRIVARNLWEILERVEKGPRRIRKVDILIAAGKAQEGDSTKHLERYALRAGLPEAEEAKRSERLVQAVRVYVEIARKAADLEGSDPDIAELEVLQGSRYLSELPPEQADDPNVAAADIIAESLRRMTERLSQRFDLPEYFAKCERHRLVLSSTFQIDHRFVTAECALLSTVMLPHKSPLKNDHYSAFNRLLEALKRCPGVYLGSVLAGESFNAGLNASLFQHYPDPDINETYSADLNLAVRCIPTWDVNLILAPFGPSQTPIPVLVRIAMTRVKPSKSVMLSCSGADDPIDFSEELTLGECQGHLLPGTYSCSLEADERINVESHYHGYQGDNSHFYMHSVTLQDVTQHDSMSLAELQIASRETLAELAKNKLFFRYVENTKVPFFPLSWTDERQHSETYFIPKEYLETSSPTVAAEGTILARLERWMRGDLEFELNFEQVNDTISGRLLEALLEAELDQRTRLLLSACDATLAEARRRLDLLLHEQKSDVVDQMELGPSVAPSSA